MRQALRKSPALAPLRAAKRIVWRTANRIRVASSEPTTRAKIAQFDKLHLGCGPRVLEGWANLDIAGSAHLTWDLRKPLPVTDHSISAIYSEHFIEHLSREDGLKLMRDCRRTLKSGATIRISTPDLRYLCKSYLSNSAPDMSVLGWTPETPCAYVNEAVRLWGHLFIYDEDEIRRMLTEAGFSDMRRMGWRQSTFPYLCDLESRPFFNDLIVEATG